MWYVEVVATLRGWVVAKHILINNRREHIVKKTDPLGCFETDGVIRDGHCGLATAVFFSKVVDTEMILWDSIDGAFGDELLHVYLSCSTCIFTPFKSKAVSKGIYLEIVSGEGGVIIDIEP